MRPIEGTSAAEDTCCMARLCPSLAPHRLPNTSATELLRQGEETLLNRNLENSMRWICTLLIVCALAPLAMPQETTSSSQQQGDNENTLEGTVVSSSRDTLVV